MRMSLPKAYVCPDIIDRFTGYQTQDQKSLDIYEMFEIFAYNIWLEAGDSPEIIEALVKIRDLCLQKDTKITVHNYGLITRYLPSTESSPVPISS